MQPDRSFIHTEVASARRADVPSARKAGGGVAIGLVGCGAIGTRLAHEIQLKFRGAARLIGVCDYDLERAKTLAKSLRPHVSVLRLAQLVRRSQLVIEAASPQAVASLLPHITRYRKPLLLLSTGGLLRQTAWIQRARRRGVRLYLPSGALCGLDGIKAAAQGGLTAVTLTTRKPPRAFSGAPGLTRRGVRLERLRKPRVLFQGSARQAISAFPQNINVAATLALAGLGAVKTRVRIVADPSLRTNRHELEARGSFGRLWARVDNRPDRLNPKTSRLAVLSALATLKQILEPIHVGT